MGTNSSSVEDLRAEEEKGGMLCKKIFKMLPFLNVNRHIKSGWHHLHSTFGRIGLRQILVDTVIAHLNLFIQHYRTCLSIGRKLTISLEAMQLEAGFNCCPF